MKLLLTQIKLDIKQQYKLDNFCINFDQICVLSFNIIPTISIPIRLDFLTVKKIFTLFCGEDETNVASIF